MRLLDVATVLDIEKDIQRAGPHTKFFEECGGGTAEYVILSHRWGDEVDYDEMARLVRMTESDRNEIKRRAGYEKIIKTCEQALRDGYRWIWIDTCCIDRRRSSELSEAVNSMYRWYRKSQKCYAYLNDVEDSTFPTKQDFNKFAKFNGWPEWFSRGWTLQELVAPKQVEFFNKDWVPIGGKQDLAGMLEKITHIPPGVLKHGRIPRTVCVAQIMSWAADRETTRMEDRAYSLLGLFDVNMPILYGEGEKAFRRLQLEIIRTFNDHSIFAWNPKGQFDWLGGVLAGDPSHFRGCHDIEKVELDEFVDEVMDYYQSGPSMAASRKFACLRSCYFTLRQQLLRQQLSSELFIVTNAGIQICLPVVPHCDSSSVFRAILACRDYYGNLITIDLTSPELQSSYRISAAVRFRHSRPELRTLYLACSAPDTEKYHYFKLDDRHASYYDFTRRGTFPREFTSDTITVSSLTNDLVVIVYVNDGAKSRFAVAVGFYLGQGRVHVAYDEYSATDEVPWRDFAKRVSDRLWSAPIEDCFVSGVKCAHLPRAIWDARVVWYSGNKQTNVMIDVERCSGCCIGPRERIAASNDWDTFDTPGFMKTVHNFRGLKLDGKHVWFYECSDQRTILGDYGAYSNGTFEPCGNIFEDMQALGIDPVDPAYHPVVSCVSSDSNVLHGKHDSLAIEFRFQDKCLPCYSPMGLSLPTNQQLVLLLKAFSSHLTGKHLVTTVIQCSDISRGDREGGRRDSESDSASKSNDSFTKPSSCVPFCTIASPQVWRREPPSVRRRGHFRSIRQNFYTIAPHRSIGAEAGHGSASKWMKHGAVKFLSGVFGLENLKNYVGEITFFEELSLMMESQSDNRSLLVRANVGPSAPAPTLSWNPFKTRVVRSPVFKMVVPPLFKKCKVFDPLVDLPRYLAARDRAGYEVKSISQTLGVGLLDYISTAIFDASEDETHGIRDTAHLRDNQRTVDLLDDTSWVNIHSTLQEIAVLQTTLDATEDEDEQRALEEDITGKILWFCWRGILSEVEQRLPEVVNHLRKEMDSMTLEGRDRFRQCLHEMGKIVKKTSHTDPDDDLAHLRRIMLDAGAGTSKHALWLAACAVEQTKWTRVPVAQRF